MGNFTCMVKLLDASNYKKDQGITYQHLLLVNYTETHIILKWVQTKKGSIYAMSCHSHFHNKIMK